MLSIVLAVRSCSAHCSCAQVLSNQASEQLLRSMMGDTSVGFAEKPTPSISQSAAFKEVAGWPALLHQLVAYIDGDASLLYTDGVMDFCRQVRV